MSGKKRGLGAVALFFLLLVIGGCTPAAQPAMATAVTKVATQAPTPTATAPAASPTPPDQPLFIAETQMLDAANGWAVGGQETENLGRILLTADGGQSWRSHPLPLASAGFAFINADEGWLLGADQDPSAAAQELYQTSDGGQTWHSLAVVAHGGNLAFVDSENGWIAAGNAGDPTLLRTVDGGRSWEVIRPALK